MQQRALHSLEGGAVGDGRRGYGAPFAQTVCIIDCGGGGRGVEYYIIASI